ncbi:MAG: GNAT family N-acetyltransferase [Vampirovibrionales bacterium]|nr:GNAT family N-acetyltransferase [Vampirovibrionales bacterium]
MSQPQTPTSTITIQQAEVSDLNALSMLFDQYRVFYGQKSNSPACSHFLFERLINHESVIFLAKINEAIVGFAQLYPGFSSVSLLPQWTLNDLYVLPDYRKRGIGKALIDRCQQLVAERQDKGLILSTAIDNQNAQRLYETCGFGKDNAFHHYEWLLAR